MSRRLQVWVVCVASCAALCGAAACTKSHDVSAAKEAPPPEDDSAAEAVIAESAGAGSPEPVREPETIVATTCDATQCAPAPIPGSGTACCTIDRKCGLDLQALGFPPFCLERDAPGTPDATCPGMTVQGFAVAGCCRAATGTCGLTADLLGLGCTVNPEALNQACGAPAL